MAAEFNSPYRGMTERGLMEARRKLGEASAEVFKLLESGKITPKEADEWIDNLSDQRNSVGAEFNERQMLKRKIK